MNHYCNRILLVEPEGLVQFAEAKCFRYWGAEVDIASDGVAALEKAQSNVYGCILFDASLDGPIDGFELINAIKTNSMNKKTPCAILDYDDELENMQKADHLSVWYFLRPISLADARDIIELAKE